MKINILYVDSSEIFGGGQISLLELLKGIDRKKFRPSVILSRAGRLKNEVEKIGLECDIIPMPKIRPYTAFALKGTIKKLADFIKKNQVSIVHTNTSRATVYTVLGTKKSGIPVIWNARIPHRDWLLDWFICPRLARIIAVSKAVKERLSWLKEDKVEIIYNGVDIQRFSPGSAQNEVRKKFRINSGDIVIGTVGRLSPEKGLEHLISAMRKVVDVLPQTKILIVGKEDVRYSLYLQAKINELELSSHVFFAGFHDDVPQILRCMDIFCLPSLTEGFNRSLLEAMACSLPVVATNVGGNIEIVQDGVNGLLVPPRNSDALASAITELMEDRQKAQKMGLEGRRLVEENFSIEENVMRMENLYEEIISLRSSEAISFKSED
jgi:glycosyltransferase involved in cell wall biosynthesis